MPMKKKQLIIITAAVLAVLLVAFAVLASNSTIQKAKRLAPDSTTVTTEAQQSTSQTETQASQTETQQTTSAESQNNKDNKKDNTTQKQQAETQKPAQTENTQRETEKKSVTVTVEVTCKNALAYESTAQNGEELNLNLPKSGYIIETESITLKKGSTVFDALSSVCSSNGVSLKYQSKAYIQSIGGLAEKDCGGSSGWMYRVNGETPMKAASKYTLSDGDRIEWYYVTSSSDR